jgi:hypothetical protein
MDICLSALIFFLAIWFLLSLVNQMGKKRLRFLQRGDPFQLLPFWNFFAPNPGVHDYYLLYRDKNEAGEVGGWQLLHPTESRAWCSFVWNPDKLTNKVLSDLVQMFVGIEDAALHQGPAVMFTLPYLICLKMVIEVPPDDTGTLRQFVLARKKGLLISDELSPILVSNFHPIA